MLVLELQGAQSALLLAAKVADIEGIVSVSVQDGNALQSAGTKMKG
jgi:hypothetical protein